MKFRRRHKGRILKGPWYGYPTFLTKLGGAEARLSCYFGGQNRRSSAFIRVHSPKYPGLTLDVRRVSKGGALERLGLKKPETGMAAFDEAFLLHAEHQEEANRFLDGTLRAALLDFEPRLSARLRVGEMLALPGSDRNGLERALEITIRGMSPSYDDLEALLEAGRLVHERLRPTGIARAA